MKKTLIDNVIIISKTGIIDEDSFSSHEYDIDVFQIFKELHSKYFKLAENLSPKDIEIIEKIDEDLQFFIDFMKKEGIDITKNIEFSTYVLQSSSILYHYYLGLKILAIDPYKIEPLLSYQRVLFLGNYYASKYDFLGLVEFKVYESIKNSQYFDGNIRLEKIVNWVERNRQFIMDKSYYNNSIQNGFDKANLVEEKIVSMDSEFARILVQKLKPYFPDEAQHPLLFDLLVENKDVKGLIFKGYINQLPELFKRLKYNNKIIVSNKKILGTWISERFIVKNKKNETLGLDYEFVYNILTKTKNEPSKSNRILTDIVQYIQPENRKKDFT